MSHSNTTLSAIQQAGAAVFAADAELKNAVREYADRVHAAMSLNPYSLGNDTMFENWKVVARLSQTMAGIEEELKKVYHLAADLIADDQPLLVQVSALTVPVPTPAPPIPTPDNLTPTDVVDKNKKRKSKPAARPAKASAKQVDKKPAALPKKSPKVSGNTAKLMQYLTQTLTTKTFSAVNQTAVAQKTGIPLGSMTAALKKATELGLILEGPAGSLKLAKPQ